MRVDKPCRQNGTDTKGLEKPLGPVAQDRHPATITENSNLVSKRPVNQPRTRRSEENHHRDEFRFLLNKLS